MSLHGLGRPIASSQPFIRTVNSDSSACLRLELIKGNGGRAPP